MNNSAPGSPLVSVLMAARNTGRFLPAAIESVLNETYTKFEFLIYDDASTDNSLEIITNYAGRDSRIRTYTSRQKAPTITQIFKFLTEQSKGEYFIFQDSDDICLPYRIQCLMERAVQNPSASLIFGKHLMVDEKLEKILQTFGEPIWPFNYFLGGFITLCASLVPIKCYNICGGFDVTTQWSGDYDLFLKLLEQAPFSYINRVLYIYRRHYNSLTFKRPDDFNPLSIIRKKAVERNLPTVLHYLSRSDKNISYRDYVALSYVIGSLVHEFFGQQLDNPVLKKCINRKFGFSYKSFLNLNHNYRFDGIENIEQLHKRILQLTENTKSCARMRLWKFNSRIRRTLKKFAKIIFKSNSPS
jgi:glycosyltransferase involved in cell wall biosynthesis